MALQSQKINENKRGFPQSFRFCRSCYNHLGGSLATDFFQFLYSQKYIKFKKKDIFDSTNEKLPLSVTDEGYSFFKSLHIYLPSHVHAYACLDGTEKKPHLGGECGAMFFDFLLDERFLYKIENDRRLRWNQEGINFIKKRCQLP